MRIQSSNVALASAHSYSEQYSREESFEFWVGSRRPAAGAEAGPRPNELDSPPPQSGRQDQASTAPSATTKNQQCKGDPEDMLSATERMMKSLLERLFGVRIRIMPLTMDNTEPPDLGPCGDSPAPTDGAPTEGVKRQGWGLDYQLRETRTESEATSFSAKGVVRTADGKEIKFDLAMSMQREYAEETQFSLKAGDALIDPLVVNFNGTAAQLTDQRYAFDLNADGQNENIPFVKAGSAFLALDKNGDGKINNGRELFGPTTGNGFSELAQYDADGNSWIDENDPVYDRLRLWSLDDAGKTKLTSLAEKNVGAIYLGNTSTPFTLKTDAQETQGQIASTGIYLKEQGGVGLVQQVNLVA